MKRIVLSFFVSMLLIGSSCVVFQTFDFVKAEPGMDYDSIDLDYIQDVAQNLSEAYFNAFNDTEIKKGRQFGTKGEDWSIERLKDEMTDIGLVDVAGGYIELNKGDDIKKTNDKIEITSKTVTVNLYEGGSNDIEGYVNPYLNCNFLRVAKYFDDDDKDLNYLDPILNPIPSELNIVNKPVYLARDPQFINNILQICSRFLGLLMNSRIAFDLLDLLILVIDQIENTYGFNILGNNLPLFITNQFNDLPDTGFVFIEENPNFNPDIDPPLNTYIFPPYHTYNKGFEFIREFIRYRIWKLVGCEGLIQYDYTSDAYDMNNNWFYKIPIIYIKGQDYETYFSDVMEEPWKSENKITVTTKQTDNSSVKTYNVIGQIDGSDPSRSVIVSSLFDIWWNQGAADSAIGMGIVMAIAKYMNELKNNSIDPKCNVKFIGFGAEEAGFYGAFDYEAEHRDDEITAVLDINQVAFTQNEPPMDFLVFTNDHNDPMDPYSPINDEIKSLAKIISDDTNYKSRTGVNFTTLCTRANLKVDGTPTGAPSNDRPFAMKRAYSDCKTFCFAKDKGENPEHRWVLHHRANEAGDKGDTMDYYDDEEVEVTAELIWNFTKYFTINPDAGFTGDVTYSTSDSPNDDDTDIDTITASFTLDTIIPHDKVRVEAQLKTVGQEEVVTYDVTDFIITSDGTSGDISLTLPPNRNEGYYTLLVYLYNSTGGINEIVYDISMPDDDATSNSTYLYPRGNEPAEKPSTPSGDTTVTIGNYQQYTTTSSDPNGDKIYYQYSWRHPDDNYWEITDRAFDPSFENPALGNTWWECGMYDVCVRAVDEWDYNEDNPSNSPWSEWSGPLTVTVKIFTNVYVTPSPMPYNTKETIYMAAGEETQLYSQVFGGSENGRYTWNFGDQSEGSAEANPTHSYNDAGNYTINLSIDDGFGNTSYILKNVNVTNKTIDFNMSAPICTYPNEIVYFNDTSLGGCIPKNYTWFFDVGNLSFYNMTNTSYGDFVNHTFLNRGSYDVNLTILDKQDNVFKITKTINVDYDIDHPIISDTTHTPNRVLYDGSAVVFSRIQDETSSIKSAWLNVIRPNTEEVNVSFDYITNNTFYTFFNDTDCTGNYRYRVCSLDHFDNMNCSDEYTIKVDTILGNTKIGDKNQSMTDRCGGSNFTMNEYGTVNSITAYVYSPYATPLKKSKCKIFRTNDTVCIGTSEEKSFNNSIEGRWMTYNFSDPMPNLEPDTDYILSIWSDGVYLFYDDVEDELGRHYNVTYGPGFWQNPIPWVNETRLYSIYCNYSKEKYPPKIDNVNDNPDKVGFGESVTIKADVTDNISGVYTVKVNVTYPDETIDSFTMENIVLDTYQHVFNDTWLVGRYNYTIWAVDNYGNQNTSVNHSFNVSANATIGVCTVKNTYVTNESFNITDPPGGSPVIGYELLDDDSVLHIWNAYDDYYFDTDSGIQLTNHYDESWSHNVFMLGYYNNNQWNLMYRTDELSGFSRNIDSDNETYINITMWKDLNYNGYDFRLAIRYYLGADDNELTVTPYIKNLDTVEIPYILGFGWEMNDIQIDGTMENDYIWINNSLSYYLNQTLNHSYTNLSEPIYWFNETANETQICGFTDPAFYLIEDINDFNQKSLYLRWDKDLIYKLQVKSRDGEYNAPVTLFVRIGILEVDQEKYTDMFWYDAGQSIYYFDSYDEEENWVSYPGYMADGVIDNYAFTASSGDFELLDSNNYTGGGQGTISKVEIRAYGYYNEGERCRLIIRPVFTSEDGDNHYFDMAEEEPAWSSWFDITDDTNAPSNWSWSDIGSLDCDIEKGEEGGTYYCSKVEIRVTYKWYPVVSSPVPADNTINVTISPTLSIDVSDADGDLMNITWYSNSSGSWVAFGTNNSACNGTYSQMFSNASVNGQWWYWKVNVSDGWFYTESGVFKFYTGIQSKIVNTGSTNISGYLLMQVEYYNESFDWWFVDNVTIDDSSPRTINISDQIGLDLIFNGLLNISDLTYGNGTYRIYVEYRDPYGNVLVCDDGTDLEAFWEFEVDII